MNDQQAGRGIQQKDTWATQLAPGDQNALTFLEVSLIQGKFEPKGKVDAPPRVGVGARATSRCCFFVGGGGRIIFTPKRGICFDFFLGVGCLLGFYSHFFGD